MHCDYSRLLVVHCNLGSCYRTSKKNNQKETDANLVLFAGNHSLVFVTYSYYEWYP